MTCLYEQAGHARLFLSASRCQGKTLEQFPNVEKAAPEYRSSLLSLYMKQNEFAKR